MKNVVITDDHNLIFDHSDTPIISDDECLVKVKAIGINRADLLQKAGMYPAPKGESEILGIEMSGIVTSCGTRVSNVGVGDRVFGLVPGGAYAEFVKVKANHLFSLPTEFDFETGAAIAEVFLTAYQCMFSIAKIKSGSNVLIHAGASGVGTAAIQLAKEHNCYVVATVSNEEKRAACLKLGADEVINYREQDFVAWSKENLPQGFDYILDVVAGDYVNKNINVSALDGKIVILSMLGGRYCEKLDIAKMLAKRVSLSASTLRNRSNEYKAKLNNQFREQFWDALVAKRLLPVIDNVYSWQEVETAHTKMAANKNIGKLILTVDSL